MSVSGADSLVVAEVRGGVATLTLNRPHKRNALSSGLVAALSRALVRAAADQRARVVALQGAGPDFCAGADLSEIAASQQQEGPEAGLADARSLGKVFVTIRRMDKPVVALVRGRALGGGCGLATAVALTKRLFHGLHGVAFEDAIARGAEINAMARMTEECREGVKRFLDRKGG